MTALLALEVVHPKEEIGVFTASFDKGFFGIGFEFLDIGFQIAAVQALGNLVFLFCGEVIVLSL